MSRLRVGVYGGTFDPVHDGHLSVAEKLTARFGLDRLLFVPAASPPHKVGREISHPCHRFAMVALALAARRDWVLSTVELGEDRSRFTVETIARLNTLWPEAVPFYFIMGADSFEELGTWRDYLRLVESCHIIVTARPGHRLDEGYLPESVRRKIIDLTDAAPGDPVPEPADGGTGIYLTDDAFVDISSTRVREAVRERRSIRDLVPASVADYIEKQELYTQRP